MTDTEVWEAVLAGQSESFGLIWDRHRNRVFRHLLGSGVSAPDAEDLTAVTFLELWRRRRAVRFVDSSLLAWLLVTAGNVSRNAKRSRGRYQAFLVKLPKSDFVEDPAEVVAGGDSRGDALAVLLDKVGRLDRQLLTLTAVEGFTVAESAAALGLSEAAAKMRLSRVRKRLRISIDAQVLTEGEPA
jgi:RNA polymerase sigma factor (sigma-70 family)